MAPGDEDCPEEIRNLLGSLTDLERRALVLRFRFDGGDPRTLEEVSEATGLSLQELRAIEGRALELLQADLDSD
ncbi:MAG: sigma factor-like helix-turn-helix DNA-binding protein [Actinomycetota bacterium]